MVLARSCALTAVTAFLATWLRRQEQTVRQQLREWCYEADAKRGDQRQDLESRPALSPCCSGSSASGRAPNWPWPSMPPRWAPASRSWRSASSIAAVPCLWPGPSCQPTLNMPGAANGCGCCACCGPSPGLDGDRVGRSGLYAGWLFRRIVRLGWHPFLRINAGGTFRPAGSGRFSRCRRSHRPAPAGMAPAPPSNVRRASSTARCWPAGRRGTQSRG